MHRLSAGKQIHVHVQCCGHMTGLRYVCRRIKAACSEVEQKAGRRDAMMLERVSDSLIQCISIHLFISQYLFILSSSSHCLPKAFMVSHNLVFTRIFLLLALRLESPPLHTHLTINITHSLTITNHPRSTVLSQAATAVLPASSL